MWTFAIGHSAGGAEAIDVGSGQQAGGRQGELGACIGYKPGPIAGADTLSPMMSPSCVLSQTRVEQFILLRAAVGFLGEKDQFGWWDTSFLGAIGQKYLAITFPRSALAAGLQAAALAARRVHDERIGKGRVCHLFRLPHGMEQRLHQQGLRMDAETLLKALQNRDAALQTLQSMARAFDPLPTGPIRLGDAKALDGPTAVGKLAAIYLGAFKASTQAMPYFTAAD